MQSSSERSPRESTRSSRRRRQLDGSRNRGFLRHSGDRIYLLDIFTELNHRRNAANDHRLSRRRRRRLPVSLAAVTDELLHVRSIIDQWLELNPNGEPAPANRVAPRGRPVSSQSAVQSAGRFVFSIK